MMAVHSPTMFCEEDAIHTNYVTVLHTAQTGILWAMVYVVAVLAFWIFQLLTLPSN